MSWQCVTNTVPTALRRVRSFNKNPPGGCAIARQEQPTPVGNNGNRRRLRGSGNVPDERTCFRLESRQLFSNLRFQRIRFRPASGKSERSSERVRTATGKSIVLSLSSPHLVWQIESPIRKLRDLITGFCNGKLKRVFSARTMKALPRRLLLERHPVIRNSSQAPSAILDLSSNFLITQS